MAGAAWSPDGPRRAPEGFRIPPRARLPAVRSRATDRLVIGAHATLGSVRHAGTVVLCQGASAQGVTAGHEVVVGAAARCGPIRCRGRIVVQAGAVVGDLQAGADVLLLGSCTVGDVVAGGDIIVVGVPRTGLLQARGRLHTRRY